MEARDVSVIQHLMGFSFRMFLQQPCHGIITRMKEAVRGGGKGPIGTFCQFVTTFLGAIRHQKEPRIF